MARKRKLVPVAGKGPRFGVELSIKTPWSLYKAGYSKNRESVFLIHGFNGTAQDNHLVYLRDAYLSRDYNVITVDWKPLTQYPCYLTALINTRLAAQCAAQIYSFITHHGTPREKITCVGHSLGAHICGMISNHLTKKQYRIIGLDPARPLIERKKTDSFRLTIDDATVIQVIHTNAGFLGQSENTGHLNYCINGGMYQPYCRGHPIRRSRCSHFMSICFLANAMFKHKKFIGIPCPNGCVKVSGPGRLPVTTRDPFKIESLLQEYKMGNDAPDNARGCFCLDVPYAKHCPFTQAE
ncbi:lipase member H-A [Episyrphus balteatus]|uniref:lipase member H-A n=1 Tax=Episyrphus balteatus TaxID=286459 RepID=UPI0024866EE1|nr:lipase member H-A [Episyrphus balteatus]